VVTVLLRHEIRKLPSMPSGHCPSGEVIDCTAGDPYPTIGASEFAADPQKPVFTGDVELRLLAHDLSADCASAATGALVGALDQRGCTQVARSTYLDPTGTIVASALVFNLPDKQDAEAISTVADRDVPVTPIAATSGAARGLPDRSQPELYYKSAVTGHYALVLLVQRVGGPTAAESTAGPIPSTSAPASTTSGGPTATTPAPSPAVPADIQKVMKSLSDAMVDPIAARVWGGHG
jgi:hypothetical protein